MNACETTRVAQSERIGLVSRALVSLRKIGEVELWSSAKAAYPGQEAKLKPIGGYGLVCWSVVAVLSFHGAFLIPRAGSLILLFFISLLQLARVGSFRWAMYLGLGIGIACYGPHLHFFWGIFGPSAIALWAVLAFFLGLFLALVQAAYVRHGLERAVWLAPLLWMGLEYFRSELYFLRFSWLSAGFAFAETDQAGRIVAIGLYGVGFVLMLGAACIVSLPNPYKAPAGALILAIVWFFAITAAERNDTRPAAAMKVAGVQLEFASPQEVESALERLFLLHPDTDLFVLSEYTFDGPVPANITAWCRRQGKHLMAGGKHEIDPVKWFNTAFVIDPAGKVVFQQAKSVPIQFFRDGLPATDQRVWNSPWGKIGVGVCYDLSYTRVVDRFARQGAQALIFPTMDVQDWGEYQHMLHARVAPLRAAEHRIPVFRLTSSGISQLVSSEGRVLATAGFPGQGETIVGTMKLGNAAILPPDRRLAQLATFGTGLWMLWLLVNWLRACATRSHARR